MLTQNTLDTLRQLKLTGMCDALEQQRAQPDTHDLAFEERLALLIDREVLHRENRRLDRLLLVSFFHSGCKRASSSAISLSQPPEQRRITPVR